jgi:hypothetical protein
MTTNDMEAFRLVQLKMEQGHRGSVAILEEEAFHNSDGTAMGNLSDVPVEDPAERANPPARIQGSA